MNLRPQGRFTVVRQIENHLDTDTNYVQAVIRNAYTDAIIATLQLTDKGSQRFSKNWTVPADPSGQGFFVSIVTSVYTDSAYTTKNPNYGDQENTYKVVDDTIGSRGGGSLDTATVRRIFKEELKKATDEIKANEVEPPEPPEPPVMRWDEILGAVQKLPDAFRALLPEEKEPNLQPILSVLDEVKTLVNEKEVTPETELAPVLEAISEVEKHVELCHQEMLGRANEIPSETTAMLMPKVEDAFRNIELQIAPSTATGTVKKEKAPPEPAPIDLHALAT